MATSLGALDFLTHKKIEKGWRRKGNENKAVIEKRRKNRRKKVRWRRKRRGRRTSKKRITYGPLMN